MCLQWLGFYLDNNILLNYVFLKLFFSLQNFSVAYSIMLHLYKKISFSYNSKKIAKKLQQLFFDNFLSLEEEICYNVDLEKNHSLSDEETKKLLCILQVFSNSSKIEIDKSSFENYHANCCLVEIGPRLNQKTAFCTNALSICNFVGLTIVKGIEISWRYLIKLSCPYTNDDFENLVKCLHDPMTQCRYIAPLQSLQCNYSSNPWYSIDMGNNNGDSLKVASDSLGLAFDDWDIKFYTNLFSSLLNRNPTTVECFDLAQSNSEHSRHWFFKGKIFIDGKEQTECLFKMVIDTLSGSNKNNKISFNDNGSAIAGFVVQDIVTEKAEIPSNFVLCSNLRHLTLTAETHNFPTGIAPFPGAATGSGGRQRDQHAIGRGASIVAGMCGYCVGNLNLPNHALPWEKSEICSYPSNLAIPSKIIIDASNGASDYGNKFGEPVVSGFFRSFGLFMPNGERTEWLKPIMFSSGIGAINDEQLFKVKLDKKTSDVLVAKIGGPAYRIGVGGGCASSLMHGENDASRDFNAVQRGDAEMQQKLHRVVKACYEHKENPILSIHDQGAGGNGNVLKEIVEPSGALIFSKAFTVGDETLNTQELWTAEYQESDAILLHKTSLNYLKQICRRERCTLDIVGELNGSGKITLSEKDIVLKDGVPHSDFSLTDETVVNPVDLDLELVLGKMPQKHFYLQTYPKQLKSFDFSFLFIKEALNRVLQLPAVASKRFLTNKVDRSVSGLIAQQQCIGPLHTPLADVAVASLSHFANVGTATAIGEQPIKMLVNECAGARMAVGESLTNIVFAPISDIKDIKCSANWMWPAKLPGEGAKLYRACQAMCSVMKKLGIAVDGGKDSLSMAASVDGKIVKSPGSLVVSLYAPCVDIKNVLTPDLRCPNGCGWLVYVPMSKCHPCLGGSALAQCYNQIGSQCPDLDDASYFVTAWKMTQKLLQDKLITSGHDVSDGGFITCVLEMAFSGNCGLDLDIEFLNCSEINFLFAENLGIILETNEPEIVIEKYNELEISAMCIGKSIKATKISIRYNNKKIIDNEPTSVLRDVWESTSFALEKLQCDENCVEAERTWLMNCTEDPCYRAHFNAIPLAVTDTNIRVAVLREEGSNGDREMAAAFFSAGFQPWDVTMQDLIDGNITLDRFRGLAFVGGFSYADVFGSAKGWASCCLYNDEVRLQLQAFKSRDDIFSLGVCNGCQLMALLGWVGEEKMPCSDNWCEEPPALYLGPNKSGRFESRFSSVKIMSSNSIMFKDMEESVLGVWVAHGEGKFCFSSESLLRRVIDEHLSPLRFVDHRGDVTTDYPLNPNGSPHGIAGICSRDGRHLAVMPHPERCFQMWQWPWKPAQWADEMQSPWLRMFQNAYAWCLEN